VTHYGIDFCSALRCGNICGVQFHPEKSHKYGMQLLANFCRADG
jgi:glutamine amidotransferase